MSISPINTNAQTGLVPNSLLGYSTNGVSAIEILPTSITLGGDLTTTPIYVGISAATGLTTTNPTGLNVNCDFNMNNNDITTLETISFNNTTTTNTYSIGVNTNDLVISAGGDRLLLDSGNNEFYLGEFYTGTAPSISSSGSSTKTISINSRDGISQIGDTDNAFNQTKIIVNDSSFTIDLTSTNGTINTNAPNSNSYGNALPICLNQFENGTWSYTLGGQVFQNVFSTNIALPTQFFAENTSYASTRWQINFDMNCWNFANAGDKGFAIYLLFLDGNGNPYDPFLYNQQTPYCKWDNPPTFVGANSQFKSINWCDYVDFGGLVGSFNSNITLEMYIAGDNVFNNVDFKFKLGFTRIQRV